MNLVIFAYHVSLLATQIGELRLSPCAGLSLNVKIGRATGEFAGNPEWDCVSIDGVACGNRSGGIQKFAELVKEYTTKQGISLV